MSLWLLLLTWYTVGSYPKSLVDISFVLLILSFQININTYVAIVICSPTFSRITRNKSTEQFSSLPYIFALMNCLICTWYGLPFVSEKNILVTTVNGKGAIFSAILHLTLYCTFPKGSTGISISSCFVESLFYICLNIFVYSCSLICWLINCMLDFSTLV